MSHWIVTLLAFILVAGAFAAISNDVDGANDVGSFVMPFYGMEKKWSRREPSIRFFKRNGGEQAPVPEAAQPQPQEAKPTRFWFDY